MDRIKILQVAISQIGLTESPPNSNETPYGKWYGMDKQPWCAMFVSWVYDQAGSPLPPIQSAKGFAYCPLGLKYFQDNNFITNNPQKGDIVIFDWQGDGKPDHTGIFIQPLNRLSFISLEGNTSITNDSNGGQVMLRVRPYNAHTYFIDPKV